jgi:protease II
MSSKFVARLKDCSDGQSTILMRTDFDTGHGLTVSTGSSKASLWADIYALMFFAMGVKPPFSSNPEKDVLSNQTITVP